MSVEETATGSLVVHTSPSRLLEPAITIPPVDEQLEIGRRVSELLDIAGRIEARTIKALAHIDQLRPSLLAKAFRGDLVPTEAELARQEGRDYQPASVLLERLQRERDGDVARSKASFVTKKVRRVARSSRRPAMSR
jgi:type I restriction enzyme S subunit